MPSCNLCRLGYGVISSVVQLAYQRVYRLCKTAMCFDDQISGNTCLTLKTVDILCEQFEQQAFLVQKVDKRVCDCWPVFPWIELLRKRVERKRILAKE